MVVNNTVVTGTEFQTEFANSTRGLEGDPDICIFAQEISLVVNVITLIVGLIIIAGNSLVIFVILRYPAKKFTPLYWLLFHLAVADLCIGLTVFFWYGVAEILQFSVTLTVKVFLYGISIVAVIASFQGLMMIAFDRYLLILHTVRYKTIFTKRRTVGAIVFMWVFPAMIQVVAPMSGWSCVSLCDCRIHNINSDAMYCFDPSCSQNLPPVKSLQLFLASFFSCLAFIITMILYVVMFYGIHKQSKKLQSSMANSRKASSGSLNTQLTPTADKSLSPTTPSSLTSNKAKAAGWSSTNEGTRNNAFQFDTFSNSLSQENTNSNSDETRVVKENDNVFEAHNPPTKKSHNKLHAPPPTPISPGFGNPVFYRANEPPTPTSPKPNVLEEPKVKLRPKSLALKQNGQRRQSITQSVIGRIRRLTQSRRRQRSSANRRRDVRVMRSMFIIMTVFVLTTCPLMVFILYTYANNDRKLKEIFNILLQITTLNSLLNPFLYFSRIPAMRNKLKKLINANSFLRKWKPRTNRPASPGTNRTERSDSWDSGQSE